MNRIIILLLLMFCVNCTVSAQAVIKDPGPDLVKPQNRNIEKTINGINYWLNTETKTATVTKHPGDYSGKIVIPSNVTYNGVKYSVTSIGVFAFALCKNLTTVNIPNSVTSIGNGAFQSSSLTTVNIPNSVTNIGRGAFYLCSGLTSIVIPNNLTTIEEKAFFQCQKLTSITIPGSITSIGESAFCGCSSLTSITVSPENTVYDSRDNCNAIIETSTNTLVFGCMNTKIPNSVTSISEDGFYCCSSLKAINIPNSVTNIETGAFMGCYRLESISVSPGNTVYDSRDNCNAIIEKATNTLIVGCKNSVIPNSVIRIGKEAFYASELDDIIIPNSVTEIEEKAFGTCDRLQSIVIPNGVINIGKAAFYECVYLKTVKISNSVKNIGDKAFQNCYQLTDVYVNNLTPPILSMMSFSNKGKITLHVPKGARATYLKAENWNGFKEIVEDGGVF